MGRCGDCRWYEPMDLGEGHVPSGTCLLLSEFDNQWPEPAGLTQARQDALAFADNIDDYPATLTVFPDFGCVHFTAKD